MSLPELEQSDKVTVRFYTSVDRGRADLGEPEGRVKGIRSRIWRVGIDFADRVIMPGVRRSAE